MVILVVNWTILYGTHINGSTIVIDLISRDRQYDILEGVRGRYAISQFGDCYL
jgi:hypothetical protein